MDNDHFSFGHFLNRILGAFLAHSTVFEPAVGHEVGAPLGSPINVDIAGVDLLGIL